eukprot:1690105-Pleurochrysis_carterae.AAC.1
MAASLCGVAEDMPTAAKGSSVSSSSNSISSAEASMLSQAFSFVLLRRPGRLAGAGRVELDAGAATDVPGCK